MQHYRDRTEAGWRLAINFADYAGCSNVLALAISRGGALVAYEIAQALGVQMDLFLARELSVPEQANQPIGVIAREYRHFNELAIQKLHWPRLKVEAMATQVRRQMEQLEQYCRDGRQATSLQDREVILVDDGLSSGSVIRTAARAARQHRPARLIIAIPAVAASTLAEFRGEADRVACAVTPAPFHAAGSLYDQSAAPSDQELRNLMERSARRQSAARLSRAHGK